MYTNMHFSLADSALHNTCIMSADWYISVNPFLDFKLFCRLQRLMCYMHVCRINQYTPFPEHCAVLDIYTIHTFARTHWMGKYIFMYQYIRSLSVGLRWYVHVAWYTITLLFAAIYTVYKNQWYSLWTALKIYILLMMLIDAVEHTFSRTSYCSMNFLSFPASSWFSSRSFRFRSWWSVICCWISVMVDYKEQGRSWM